MIRFIKKLRGLNHVFRWNFHPHVRRENVAEHSFWVAVFTHALANFVYYGETSKIYACVMNALYHDAEEAITGDLPALVKRKCRYEWRAVEGLARQELLEGCNYKDEMEDLISHAHTSTIVKAADLFAALIYATEEKKFGNANFNAIEKELVGSLVGLCDIAESLVAGAILRLLSDLSYDVNDRVLAFKEMSHL